MNVCTYMYVVFTDISVPLYAGVVVSVLCECMCVCLCVCEYVCLYVYVFLCALVAFMKMFYIV